MVMLKGWTTGRLLALIRRFTGNLSSLTTPSKADLVSAINSLNPQFSSTPVYDVTLAEDTEARSSNPLTITTDIDNSDICMLVLNCTPCTNATNRANTVQVNGWYGNDKIEMGIESAIFSDGIRSSLTFFQNFYGMVVGYGGNFATGTRMPLNKAAPLYPFFRERGTGPTRIELFHFSGAYFAAGTRITIYAAS